MIAFGVAHEGLKGKTRLATKALMPVLDAFIVSKKVKLL